MGKKKIKRALTKKVTIIGQKTSLSKLSTDYLSENFMLTMFKAKITKINIFGFTSQRRKKIYHRVAVGIRLGKTNLLPREECNLTITSSSSEEMLPLFKSVLK